MLDRPPIWWLSSGFLRSAIVFLSETVPLASVLGIAPALGLLPHRKLHELHAETHLPHVGIHLVGVEALVGRVDLLLVAVAPAEVVLPEANRFPF